VTFEQCVGPQCRMLDKKFARLKSTNQRRKANPLQLDQNDKLEIRDHKNNRNNYDPSQYISCVFKAKKLHLTRSFVEDLFKLLLLNVILLPEDAILGGSVQ
jgi:hypothetical protein